MGIRRLTEKTEQPRRTRAKLSRHGARLAPAGVDEEGRTLPRGPAWPPLEIPRSSKVTSAERAFLKRQGLVSETRSAAARVVDGRGLSDLIRTMKREVADASPTLAATLDRELAGRRFFAHYFERYEALYANDAAHPELGRT